MAEASPSNPTRSSVLFALGELTGEVREMGRTQQNMPGNIMAALQPTIQDHGALILTHDGRLTRLERRQWLWLGGGGALLTLATLVGSLTVIHIHV